MFEGYQSQLPEPVEADGKFDIYVFATRAQWDAYTKQLVGSAAAVYLKIKAGAYYFDGKCVAYNIGLSRTASVLGHEGWHQFNNKCFAYRLPSWLDEGIATLFESPVYENGRWKFSTDRNMGRLGSLKFVMLKGKSIPIRELIAFNPGQAIMDGDEAIMGFYAQSYAMVRFLREDDYGLRLGNYHQMLLGALNGTWSADENLRQMADKAEPMTTTWNSYMATKLFNRYIGSDFYSLEKQYKIFCGKITYRVRVGK